jgi:hypothetical protein
MAKRSTPQYPSNSLGVNIPVRNGRDTPEEEELIETEELEKEDLPERRPKARLKKKKRNTLFSFLFREGKDIVIYIWSEVFLPGVKEMIQSGLENGIDMAFNGTDDYSGYGGKRNRSGGPRVISYNDYFNGSSRSKRNKRRTRPKRANRLDGITFEFPGEARQVLNTMIEAQDEYGVVSISDFLEAAGLHETIEPTDTVRGWGENISRAKIRKTNDNDFVIDFPRPENISE